MEEPGYIALYRSGELERRASRLEARLAFCDICPRECHCNRLQGERGFCNSGKLPLVSSFCAHHGEEPVISGKRGSGTIFFCGCNLRCVYCQNYQISQQRQRCHEIEPATLAGNMLYLQDELGCHNINLVSPTHFVPQIVRALVEAVPRGLHLPLVYNTNSYDSVETLEALDGVVNIYMPDLKYASDASARRYSDAPHYVSISRRAIREMYRQVGGLVVDSSGVAKRGLVVRHLILPDWLAGSRDSLEWLAKELSRKVAVSAMSQYHPVYRALQYPELSRKISVAEYRGVLDTMAELGLSRGWMQEMDSSDDYLPDFEGEGHPFG